MFLALLTAVAGSGWNISCSETTNTCSKLPAHGKTKKAAFFWLICKWVNPVSVWFGAKTI